MHVGVQYCLPRGYHCTGSSSPSSSSCRAAPHGYPWSSLATFPYRSSPPAGLLEYIPYLYIAAVCMFELVVLLLLGHKWGSIGVHHLSLLLQQCPACLVRLTWIIFVMGSRTWVCSKRKKGEVFDTCVWFYVHLAIASVYPSEIPTHPLTLADLTSEATGPNSSLGIRLSLTVTIPRMSVDYLLLLTTQGPCFPSSSSGLLGNLTHKPFVWVSRQNRQRNPLTGTQPHPQKRMHPHRVTLFDPDTISVLHWFGLILWHILFTYISNIYDL